MSRYFEIIITGRQLAALVGAVALLVAVGFGLGVGVQLLRAPAPAPAAAAPAPTPEPVPTAAPPVVPTAGATPPALPTAVPTATPFAAPTAPPVEPEKPRPHATAARAPNRWVQVAAFGRHDQAEGVRNRVIALGFTPRQALVEPAPGGKFRVRVGPFPDGESAGRVAARLRAEGFPGAFVVRPGE
jgi:cell division protein FtsN